MEKLLWLLASEQLALASVTVYLVPPLTIDPASLVRSSVNLLWPSPAILVNIAVISLETPGNPFRHS